MHSDAEMVLPFEVEAPEQVVIEEIWELSENGAWANLFGKNLSEFTASISSPRVLSLFSGAGGLDIGFSDCGFDIVEKIEFESLFCQTLEANSGENKQFRQDTSIQCIDVCQYEANLKEIDFIIGGPPCQSFSAAGARAAGVVGTNDDRGKLFNQYVRLLEQIQPKGFLFENVYRILGANQGRDWQAIHTSFTDAGYELHHRILDTADYGVPQHRERLIIVGMRKDIAKERNYQFPRPTHGPDSIYKLPHISAEKALHGVIEQDVKKGLNGRYGHLLSEIPPGLNYSFFTEKMEHPNPVFAWRSKFSDFLYKADPKRPVRTIKAQGGQYTGPFHWEARAFTLNELKRLQSFPDTYQLIGGRGEAIKQIGNSVPPQFARMLACSIADQLFDIPLPFKAHYLNDKESLGFRKRKRALTKLYQSIAREAIEDLTHHAHEVKTENFIGNLSDDLRWSISKRDGFSVSESIKDENLEISFDCGWSFIIHIKPYSNWAMPFKSVSLRGEAKAKKTGDSIDELIHLISFAWKSLEHFLIRNDLKADLVQLSGYYQYASKFSSSLAVDNFSDESSAISEITSGYCINQELSEVQLAHLLNLELKSVLPFLKRLKKNGYEIRSHSTNPSIEKGLFLIPYSFPTLNEKSVQRRKELD